MRTSLSWASALAVFVLTSTQIPASFRREPLALCEGDEALEEALGEAVWDRVEAGPGAFSTGSARFDSEWQFGTWQMAALTFEHLARRHPEHRERHLDQAEAALTRLLDPASRTFDTEAWGVDLADDPQDRGHLAALSYVALPLALHREARPVSPFTRAEEETIARLTRHLEAAGGALSETYPHERYVADHAAGIGALAVHDRATGEDHRARIEAFFTLLEAHGRDPETGVVYQALGADNAAVDAPKGSGTFFTAWFLAYADPVRSKALYERGRESLWAPFLGFGAMLEVPPGHDFGGDIDSGPVVLGRGVSATGFALASARIHGDCETFGALGATAWLFGAPVQDGPARRFVAGGPLGEAIMGAVLTATAAPIGGTP